MVSGGGRSSSFKLALLLVLAAQASVLLFFQPRGAKADFLSPFISPFKNASCEIAQCGKGTCKPSDGSSNSNSFLGLLGLDFTCDCDPGWKRLFNDDPFRFLPCVFPNCTISSSCSSEALAPPPPPSPSLNFSNWAIFDPCALSACGEGTCVKTSSLAYSCDCKQGTTNLLNLTNLPCLQDCVLGADCSQLGLGYSKPPSPSSSSSTTTTTASPTSANKDSPSVPTVPNSPPTANKDSPSAPTASESLFGAPPSTATRGSEMNLPWLSVLMLIIMVASIP